MAAIKVPTNFNIELEFEIPEFYRRFLSLLIDMLVEFFYVRILLAVISNFDWYSFSESTSYNLYGVIILLFVPVMVYHAVCEIFMNGQSIGKKITGLRVVDEFGGKPGISQYLIRWLLRISDVWIILLLLIVISSAGNGGPDGDSLFIVLFGLGFLLTEIVLVASSRKGQRIGDLLARTIVIRINTKSHIHETVFQEVADNYVPSFPQIMQLSDKDINAIKSILETARKKGDYQMAEAAALKIKTHLKLVSDISSFDFLETLLKDYNYLSVK